MITLTRKENGILLKYSDGAFLVCDISEKEIKSLKSYLCGYSLDMCEPHINDIPLPKDLSTYTDENIGKICEGHTINNMSIDKLISLEPTTDERGGLPRLVKQFNSLATIPTVEEMLRIYLLRDELDNLNSKGYVFRKMFEGERVATVSLYSNPFYYYCIENETLTIDGLSSNCVTFPIIRVD
jgi:hypothetical protein